MQRTLPFGPEALLPFARELFNHHEDNAARLMWSILETRSPRKSDWSRAWSDTLGEDSSYRAIDRAIAQLRPKQALNRLFDPSVPFVLVDPTVIERPQAKKTPYVGELYGERQRLGFFAVVLAQPQRGRVVPFHGGIYSHATLEQEGRGRADAWQSMLLEVRNLIGATPLVFDREFSSQHWLETLEDLGVNYAVRLNQGRGARLLHDPVSPNRRGGRPVESFLLRGESVQLEGVYYKGSVRVNLAGVWHPEHDSPLWVMGNLEPEALIATYFKRMKIEEGFRDLKNLLGLTRVMSKKRVHLEETMALMLLAYAAGLTIGELVRDEAYGRRDLEATDGTTRSKQGKWVLYSGLFVLLKQRLPWSKARWRQVLNEAFERWRARIWPPGMRLTTG
jgi:Transposase DDE domain